MQTRVRCIDYSYVLGRGGTWIDNCGAVFLVFLFCLSFFALLVCFCFDLSFFKQYLGKA